VSPVFFIAAFAVLAAQFVVPRRIAFFPLLIAVFHLPNETVLQVGVSFTITKLVILAGLLRAAQTRMFVWSPRQPVDVLVLVWACWTILSGFGHHPSDSNPFTVRLSWVYEITGAYLYGRAYLRNYDDILNYSKCMVIVLVPMGLLIFFEKITAHNPYATILAGMEIESLVREGKVRAQGVFSHPILAGTAGAGSAIFLIALWRQHRRWAIAGVVACLLILFSCASSGPLMMLIAGLAALGLWRWRLKVGLIRTIAICAIIGLHLVMKAPVWYLMSRVDLAGGSTGWHRAELITQAIDHFNEWWLIGTDYTRHWMPYGVNWSGDQADITNYYLKMGVIAGFPLVLLFIAILFKTFQMLGRRMAALRKAKEPSEFILWCMGSALFGHCVNFLSISYFDQNYVLLYLLIGAVPGVCAAPVIRARVAGSRASANGRLLTTRRPVPGAQVF
jgi:hypothetical protein